MKKKNPPSKPLFYHWSPQSSDNAATDFEIRNLCIINVSVNYLDMYHVITITKKKWDNYFVVYRFSQRYLDFLNFKNSDWKIYRN